MINGVWSFFKRRQYMTVKRKELKRRFCAGAAAACFCISSLGGIPVQAEESGDVAMGRYLESEVMFPEDSFDLVRDIVSLPDGRLRVIGMSDDGLTGLWDSRDGGETWEQAAVLPEAYMSCYFMDTVLGTDGSGVGIYLGVPGDAAEDDEAEQTLGWDQWGYCSFDADGNVLQDLPLPEGDAQYVWLAADGSLIVQTYSGEVSVRDRETDEVIRVIAGDAELAGTCGGEVFTIADSSVLRYDIGTGEPLGRDEALEEALFADGETYAVMSTSTYPIVFAQDEERLYYATKKGIYSHVMGGSVVEQIVDGSLNSLSDPSIGLMGMAVQGQVFYVICTDGQGGIKMMKYEYSDEVASTPSRELTIWSMRENNVVRQMAVLFQKEYPDTYVNCEYGISGEDGVTASDALRTLNTEILAGSGPDILVLDDMSVQTYADQGILADLGDILSEAAENDGLFENIAGAYRDGEYVPAIPALFCIPVAAGRTEYADRVTDLASFVELASEQDVLDPYIIPMLPELLYPVCAGAWKNEDNTINQEKLTEYVSAVREICENYRESASESMLEKLELWLGEDPAVNYADVPGLYIGDITMSILDYAGGLCSLMVGNMTNADGYAQITSAYREDGDGQVSLLGGLQSGVFRPYCVLGILNTASEQERAGDFVRFALSEQAQSQQYSNGFPVDKKAFEILLTAHKYGDETGMGFYSSTEGGEDIELNVYWPDEEQADSLRQMVEQLSVCSEEEYIQKETIQEQTRSCMMGEISVEEAVNTIMQKINLYLAE